MKSSHKPSHITEPLWLRLLLIALTCAFMFLIIGLPLIAVFYEALRNGYRVYISEIVNPEALQALWLTLTVVAIVVPVNVIFGIVASWAITKFDFVGRNILISLIDLPFSVSPVIAGLIYVILFGTHSIFYDWLQEHDIQILFALPGIVLASIFVTFPFVARELIPLMEEQGSEEEEAAILLGATGLQTFLRITLPNISWGLLYGVLLCTARTMGEFGAVSVVSGHIRGETMTLPLQVEVLYNEYNFVAAFAVASILAAFSLFSLILKHVMNNHILPPSQSK